MAELDKFYTNKIVAKNCVDILNSLFTLQNEMFLEPTAGNGVFLPYLPQYEAYDLKPENPLIKQQDIFTLIPNRQDYVVIGNPPFGKRSKLAIKVFNTVAKYSNIIAFIVPASFMKYRVQHELDSNFKLVHSNVLPKNSFLDRNKVYDVNCVFQIWVKENSKFDIYPDNRITKAPSVTHNDFKIWQYNNTPGTMKYIDEDWTYAVFRQGYKDYTKLFTQKDKQIVKDYMTGANNNGKKSQMFFIKVLNSEADERIKKLDFNVLALKNTSTPGFGKADFIKFYEENL